MDRNRRRWGFEALLVGVLASMVVAFSQAIAVAQTPSAPTPPFTQCPAINDSQSCEILLVVNPDDSISVDNDPSVGPFDGSDDTLVGIVNDSNTPVTAITVSGPGSGLSEFDGDGICSGDYAAWNGSAGCPYGPTGYEGPGTSFVTDPSLPDSAEVDFSPALAPGASGYFSLEGALASAQLLGRQGPEEGDLVTAVTFQQLNVASGNTETITNTVDGNQVDVIATLQNNSDAAQTTDVSFGDPVTDSATVGATEPDVTVPAGSSLSVDEVLDTNGLAWGPNFTPMPQRVIAVSLSDGSKASATLNVAPKPVILVHGLNSNYATWNAYGLAVDGAGGFLGQVNPLWKGYAVGDASAPGLVMNTSPFGTGYTIAQNANVEASYIQSVRDLTDAEHVDIVAHSMGGLISRYYIQNLMPSPPLRDRRPVVSHLVMLGTPNLGSDCAYPALEAEALWGGGVFSPINQPLLQLTPAYLKQFNKQVTNAEGVPFSILAGDPDHSYSCTGYRDNDGVVGVPSALWNIPDRTVEPLFHTDMTSSQPAFKSYVMPHLALGPTLAGGGLYEGSLDSSAQPAAEGDATVRAQNARFDRARAGVAPAATGNACLAATSMPALAAGETATVGDGRGIALAIPVRPDAGTLSVVVLADPRVTTRLLDPRGHAAQTIVAGSSLASGLFRTLSVRSPRAGTWHLDATPAAGAGASQVAIAVEFARSPVNVRLTVAEVHQRARRAGTLRFTAQVTANDRAASDARVTVELLLAAQRTVVLHLRAVRGHAGRYNAQTALANGDAPAVVLERTVTRVGTTTTTLQLEPSCQG
ncbi:MAG: hypothetical protein ACLP01_22900 [Solirubrobacteraceae bacterium]